MNPARIFCVFADEDRSHYERLIRHGLVYRDRLQFESMDDCPPGVDRSAWIIDQLNAAQVVVLCISADFLAASIREEAQRHAIMRGADGSVLLVRIYLRACTLDPELKRIALLPRDGRPITSWPDKDQDLAWKTTVEQMHEQILHWRGAAREAEAAVPMLPIPDAATPAAPPPWLLHAEPRAYTCDRQEQWDKLSRSAAARQSRLILLPGAQGQGHNYFVQRVYYQWPTTPNSRIIATVPTRTGFPTFEEDFPLPLAMALGCSADRLKVHLLDELRARALVILHPPADPSYQCGPLLSYHTKWLPRLHGEARQAAPAGLDLHPLVCLQPLVWSESPPWLSWLARGVSGLASYLRQDQEPGWMRRALQGHRARQLIELFSNRHSALALPPLTDITGDDIASVCSAFDMPADRRDDFIKAVFQNANRAQDVLDNLARLWPYYDAREGTGR